jgi:PAS domain S-box-containing protein
MPVEAALSGLAGQPDGALADSIDMFRTIVEYSHAGIFIIDEAYRITYANNMLSKMLDYPVADIVGSDFRRFLDKDSRQLVSERYIRRRQGESLPSRYEFKFYTRSGELRVAELSSAVVKTGGRVITVGQMLDITERKKSEDILMQASSELEMRVKERTAELSRSNELLRQSEIKYRHLIENANSIILEIDNKGDIIFINKFGLEFFGYQESELMGKNILGTIVPDVDSAGRNLRLLMKEIVRDPAKYATNENENVKKNGERVWIVWTNRPIFDTENSFKEVLCIGNDYTQQKLAEQLYTQRLQEKTASDERNRLARDLHDAVSQTLFSTSIIADVLPSIWDRDVDEGKRRLEEIRQLTRGALAEMRTLLLELRPGALADADISELLKQLGESITGRTRIPVSVNIEGKCPGPADFKTSIYRIAQEALNNVAKHSHATQASVSLLCQDNGIKLIIEDNGRGFDVAAKSNASLGMGIMRERAADIKADLEILSAPGKGTAVEVVWRKKPGRKNHGRINAH